MSIIDLFSKRLARHRGEVPDVYCYDKIPQALRVQIVLIVGDMLHGGRPENVSFLQVSLAYEALTSTLCREYGLFRLSGTSLRPDKPVDQLFNFILGDQNHERVLDAVEIATRYADRATRSWQYLRRDDFDGRVDRAIEELNGRFREHGVGYQYEEGDLVRVDSDLLHAETVKPALTLLRTKRYAGPREEFLRAYEHYRHGRHEESLTESLKAFESTMKSICDEKGWAYDERYTAKKLVAVCFDNGLIDLFWQTHISHLRGTLENGIATARNKRGGHGQGATTRTVPQSIVSYVLHMTASTIVFLIESADR